MINSRTGAGTFVIPTFWMSWMDLAVRTQEMLLASAFVINHRTDRMCKAGLAPSAPDIREFSKMVMEKNEAAFESAVALSGALLKMQTDMATQTWKHMLAPQSGPNAAMASVQQANLMAEALSDAAKAGLAPVHSRAVANRKRLSRKRR